MAVRAFAGKMGDNQRTVDNERVLRGLTRGSDSLHQQMVDQQYKLGE
jgi:hypothetical protein